MIARFLHYFPQYTLAELESGALAPSDFLYLYGGLLDVEQPEVTEPTRDKLARLTVEAHKAASKRTEWK